MNEHARRFEAKDAVRSSVPLLVGLMGPSGSGKTFSALRLATGIQRVTGGDIYYVDTEARRSLHYADHFKFKHVQFEPPHGSLDYLFYIEQCVKAGARVVVIDSMSHEHSGVGGMLDYQEHELDRMAGDDYRRREAMKMLAWQKPKAARRRLIDGLLQINANFVTCFRARETVKPVKVNGKTEIVPQGFTPVAGDEFLFEQTVNCLLLPKSNGVPTWESEAMGERQMMKLPRQFLQIFAKSRPLDEETGAALAQWARGESSRLPHTGETRAGDRAEASVTPDTPDVSAHNFSSADDSQQQQPPKDASASEPPAFAPESMSHLPNPQADSSGAPIPTWQEYSQRWQEVIIPGAINPTQILVEWRNQSELRRAIRPKPTAQQMTDLKDEVESAVARLKRG